MITEKACSKCKEVKAVSEFSFDKKGKFGIGYYCKKCAIGKSKKWYAENPVKAKETRSIYALNNKDNLKIIHKVWRENNKDIIKIKKDIYYKENREFSLIKMNAYRLKNKISISDAKKICRLNKLKHYKERDLIYRSNNKDAIKYKDKKYNTIQVNNITDVYITKSLKAIMPREAITPELIEAKRMQIKLLRLIKELR